MNDDAEYDKSLLDTPLPEAIGPCRCVVDFSKLDASNPANCTGMVRISVERETLRESGEEVIVSIPHMHALLKKLSDKLGESGYALQFPGPGETACSMVIPVRSGKTTEKMEEDIKSACRAVNKEERAPFPKVGVGAAECTTTLEPGNILRLSMDNRGGRTPTLSRDALRNLTQKVVGQLNPLGYDFKSQYASIHTSPVPKDKTKQAIIADIEKACDLVNKTYSNHRGNSPFL